MINKLEYFLSDVVNNSKGASDIQIENIKRQIDFSLPKDYLDLMKSFNGGEGEIGENSWLCLFSIEELVSINKTHIILMEQIPDYFLFGKDAADTAYVFHKKEQTIHSFGFMSNFKTDSIEFCGTNFLEFSKYLYNS